jgi:hypothetical protein
LQTKIAKDNNQIGIFSSNLVNSKLPNKIANLVKVLSSKTDLSPRGFVACLIFISDLISIGNNVVEDFVEETFIKSLVGMLKDNQV